MVGKEKRKKDIGQKQTGYEALLTNGIPFLVTTAFLILGNFAEHEDVVDFAKNLRHLNEILAH